MIRQAISCDICGSEKKQTNHWFVAYEQGGELRIGGWTSKNRLRAGAHHLCGQTCLHKLVDDFMARSISSRPSAGVQESAADAAAEGSAQSFVEDPRLSAVDASLTSAAAYPDLEFESSARLIPSSAPAAAARTAVAPPRLPLRPPVELVPASRLSVEEPPPTADEVPSQFHARSWRAEAWERERERELRAVEHRPDIAARRRLSR